MNVTMWHCSLWMEERFNTQYRHTTGALWCDHGQWSHDQNSGGQWSHDQNSISEFKKTSGVAMDLVAMTETE